MKFGGSTHFVRIRDDRSRIMVGVKRAFVLGKLYPAVLLSVFPAIFWKTVSLTRLLTSSVLPHFIFKIYSLNQMNYCTFGPNMIACTWSPKL